MNFNIHINKILKSLESNDEDDRDYDNDELEIPKWKCKKCGEGSEDCECEE